MADPLAQSDLSTVATNGASRSVTPSLSLILPTLNEAGNIATLIGRLQEVLPDEELQIIFVDDSTDGTAEAIEQERERSRHEITLIHRPPERRADGLSGAVVEGFRAAKAPWVCVMDADLQHPPEVIEELVARAQRGDVDLVAASRFKDADESVDGLGRTRQLASRGLIATARALLPGTMRGLSDPLTGFFIVRRDAVELDALQPKGFKILLEIVGRTPGIRVAEIGFAFGRRHAGQSKASPRQAGIYLSQLWSLRFRAVSLRLSRFGVVGLSGLVVNTLLLAMLVEFGGIGYVLGAAIATQGSTLWNFTMTEGWVYGGRSFRRPLRSRLLHCYVMNNVALLLRAPILVLLTSGLGVNYLVSNVVSLGVLTLLRFAVSDSWIWAEGSNRGRHTYDIHGVISVVSDVPLRELEKMRVAALEGPATIDVSLGRVGRGSGEEPSSSRIRFREMFGTLGFATEIQVEDRVQVTASPILRYSPHVLYTNIVEPILRWSFVERGYALVHAACIANGDDAFIVTARTDTGKTTTILKTLDGLPEWSFLSDDLTLLAPDGRVFTYPKPMTISLHTAHAVKTPLLSRRERLALVLQSRLHSKTGREVGLKLAESRVPAATMNTIVQAIIPPPKYHVERLVPHAKLATSARLAGLVVIQRGGEGQVVLGAEEALEVIMENCEDAYGFPPYASIEAFLHSRNGADLKSAERAIVARALATTPATLLRSETMDWWQRFPRIADQVVGRISTPEGALVGPEPALETGSTAAA